jgi:uncharacterized metal-binding protein
MSGSCGCGSSAPIFACSGAADTGAISDLTARQLTLTGKGKMSCLAQIGAGNEAVIANTRKAGSVLAIDGCPVDCAKKMLENAGITGFKHLRVTDQGLKKGLSPANAENVAIVVRAADGLLKTNVNNGGGCCG